MFMGKLLLKVMHYNIVPLHKKVTNCITYSSYCFCKVMRYVLLFICVVFLYKMTFLVVFMDPCERGIV